MTTYKHSDGGTFVVVASHQTINGYGITITKWCTYKNEVLFEVNRQCPKGILFPLGRFDSEKAARTFANREWKADVTGSY